VQLPQRPQQKSLGQSERNQQKVAKIEFRHGRDSFRCFTAVRRATAEPGCGGKQGYSQQKPAAVRMTYSTCKGFISIGELPTWSPERPGAGAGWARSALTRPRPRVSYLLGTLLESGRHGARENRRGLRVWASGRGPCRTGSRRQLGRRQV
jgi:hypothetical protein